MYKVACIIPVWKRPEITRMCVDFWIKSVEIAKSFGIHITTFYIYSDEEDVLLLDELYPAAMIVYAENLPLGAKMNQGLIQVLLYGDKSFDYVMTMGSDDSIHPTAWSIIRDELENKVPAFGFNCVTFIDTETGESITGTYEVVCGAGRFFEIKNLQRICEKQMFMCQESCSAVINDQPVGFKKGTSYYLPPFLGRKIQHLVPWVSFKTELWPDDINSGLDTASGMYWESFYGPIKVIEGPYITDYKSNVNIHSFESIKKIIRHG
jgi:glycosyltransferase involved in cell wall biosynthesis